MTLDKYIQISEEEKQDAAKYFLDLIHSGNRYKAIKYYQNIDREVQKYMNQDSSCKWELDNSLREFEA